jgi:hypothetical protein
MKERKMKKRNEDEGEDGRKEDEGRRKMKERKEGK